MAIYELFEKEVVDEAFDAPDCLEGQQPKGRLFSTLVTRLSFVLLLVADVAWFVWSGSLMLLFALLHFVVGRQVPLFSRLLFKLALSFRRSAVCGLSLLIGLLSPSFGIMVACTYFLMYDKAGMEEVVPASLQAQFKDVFKG